jgi:hypothetical protein
MNFTRDGIVLLVQGNVSLGGILGGEVCVKRFPGRNSGMRSV